MVLHGVMHEHQLVARLAVVLAIGAAVLAAYGCGGNDETSTPSDGRHFAYIQTIDTSSTPATLTMDIAEFLSGEEANRAATEDGVIEEGDSVENDYYVRNPDETPVDLPITSDVSVTHVHCNGGCREDLPGTLADLAASFSDPEPKTLNDDYRGAESQYWVIVQDDEVVAIDEFYLP
jgi:hypothetical protein